MRDKRVLVKLETNAMAAVFRHDREARIGADFVDSCAHIAQMCPGLDSCEARIDGGLRHIDETPPLLVHVPDAEHARRIREVSLADCRHIDVHDIAACQHVMLTRDTMADDLVDGRADAFREALVVQVCRNRVVLDAEIVDPLVDLFS